MPTHGDAMDVVLGVRTGSWCTAVDGKVEVELASLLPPAATHGLIPCDAELCCFVDGDGDHADVLVLQLASGIAIGPVSSEDVVLVPSMPLAVAEGHASGTARDTGVAVMRELAPLTTTTAVDCVSSIPCYPVPPTCDPVEVVDVVPGEGPWIFVGGRLHPHDHEPCSQTAQSSTLHGARLQQAAAFKR